MGAHKTLRRQACPGRSKLLRFCFTFYTQMSANRKDNTTDGFVGLFNAVLAILLAGFIILF
jgi:hypothetical protein